MLIQVATPQGRFCCYSQLHKKNTQNVKQEGRVLFNPFATGQERAQFRTAHNSKSNQNNWEFAGTEQIRKEDILVGGKLLSRDVRAGGCQDQITRILAEDIIRN